MLRFLLLCCTVGAFHVNIYKNGIHMTEDDGVEVDISGPETQTAQEVIFSLRSVLVPALLDTALELENIDVYNADGIVVSTANEFKEYENYYIVPKDRLFVWPYVKVGHKIQVKDVSPADPANPVMLESISKSPRVFFVHNLMSNEEADALVERNEPSLYKSTVGSGDEGQIKVDHGRTSDNTWDSHSPAAKAIIDRVFQLLRIENREDQMDGLQLVRYKPKQFYNSHFDFLETESATEFNNMIPIQGGSNRFATLFLYLTDVDVGGQTGFPEADVLSDEELAALSPEMQPLVTSHKDQEAKEMINEVLAEGVGPLEKGNAELCYSKLSVKAKKLAGVLFYSLHPDWNFDFRSLHGGCPVLGGEKWGANLWIWNKPRLEDSVKLSVQIAFRNTFDKVGNLFWRTTMVAENVQPGATVVQDTFNTHLFRFEIDGEMVWNHRANVSNGEVQQVDIEDKLFVVFLNPGPDQLGVFWLNPEDQSEWDLGVLHPSGGSSSHNTYNGHVFKIYNLDTKRLVFTHRMTGDPPNPTIVIEPAVYIPNGAEMPSPPQHEEL